LRDGEVFIGLFVRTGTRWDIVAPLDELLAAGVDLRNLCVVRRNRVKGQRRLVGAIDHISDGTVHLSDAFDECEAIESRDVWLEGSKTAFARCLKVILGNRYRDFEEQRDIQEANLFSGLAIDKLLSKMGGFLKGVCPVVLSKELTCSIGAQIGVENSGGYTTL